LGHHAFVKNLSECPSGAPDAKARNDVSEVNADGSKTVLAFRCP
jgi:chitinase